MFESNTAGGWWPTALLTDQWLVFLEGPSPWYPSMATPLTELSWNNIGFAGLTPRDSVTFSRLPGNRSCGSQTVRVLGSENKSIGTARKNSQKLMTYWAEAVSSTEYQVWADTHGQVLFFLVIAYFCLSGIPVLHGHSRAGEGALSWEPRKPSSHSSFDNMSPPWVLNLTSLFSFCVWRRMRSTDLPVWRFIVYGKIQNLLTGWEKTDSVMTGTYLTCAKFCAKHFNLLLSHLILIETLWDGHIL